MHHFVCRSQVPCSIVLNTEFGGGGDDIHVAAKASSIDDHKQVEGGTTVITAHANANGRLKSGSMVKNSVAHIKSSVQVTSTLFTTQKNQVYPNFEGTISIMGSNKKVPFFRVLFTKTKGEFLIHPFPVASIT